MTNEKLKIVVSKEAYGIRVTEYQGMYAYDIYTMQGNNIAGSDLLYTSIEQTEKAAIDYIIDVLEK